MGGRRRRLAERRDQLCKYHVTTLTFPYPAWRGVGKATMMRSAMAISIGLLSIVANLPVFAAGSGHGIIYIGKVSPQPGPSGFFATWISVDGKGDHGEEVHLYIPYMSVEQFVPAVGSKCVYSYKIGHVAGIVGTASKAISRSKVVKSITCP